MIDEDVENFLVLQKSIWEIREVFKSAEESLN